MLIKKIASKMNDTILDLYDYSIDKKVCGTSLIKYVPSVFRDDKNGVGSTGSQSTHYFILSRMFSHVELKETDSFIDIGCGKGRVLAYLIHKKAPCSLTGIELNESVGALAAEWSKKYDHVNIIVDDAFNIGYDDYTVFFMGRPFLPKTFLQFIEKFENEITHKITLIYWVDQQSGFLLKERKGWTMNYRETVYKMYGLHVAGSPQGYSVWTYDPDAR